MPVGSFPAVEARGLLARVILAPLAEISNRANCLSRNCVATIARIAAGMAHGDLTGTLEATTAPLAIYSNDELSELATTINGIITTCQTSIDSFNAAQRAVLALVGDTTRLIGAAEAGTLSVRGDTTTPQGSYRDITARMNGTYASDYVLLQQALNAAVANLDQVLAEVAASAEQVAGAATEISSGSDALAHGAADQAASFEATTSSLTELASMARQTASHARDARVWKSRRVTWRRTGSKR